MARVALVTGGTRGIGAAISKALKAAGYKVAASYAGNDAAAEKFKAETGINVYKWDVSSFDACAEGVKKVEAEVGPVDVLVNNAGITKDGAFHKMSLEQCLEYIEDDELVEITPKTWRLRKRILNESMRKRAERADRDRAAAAEER